MSRPAPDLARLQLDLRALSDATFSVAPAEALHGAIYAALARHDPALGERIHAANPARFALSPLFLTAADLSVPVGPTVAAGTAVSAQIGLLAAEVVTGLPAAIEAHLDANGTLMLDHRPFRIERMRYLPAFDGAPILTRYADLLTLAPAAHDVTLTFISPTLFRRQDRSLVHDRDLLNETLLRQIFPGYQRRWEALSPVALRVTTRQNLLAGLHLVMTEIEPHQTPFRSKRDEDTVVGSVRFHLLGDADQRRDLATLAMFATYAGSGARTAFGRGQTTISMTLSTTSP